MVLKMNYSIALVLIVKNEQRCLERCIKSFLPHVDEVVVLDTGSTDNTMTIARQLGAKLYSFQWCDNFAVARNKALEYASCDWNLVVDADEWLVSGPESLQQLKSLEPCFVGRLFIESEAELDGMAQRGMELISRILPKNIRYKGAIHEQPIHDLPTRALNIKLAHDGYALAQRQKKQDRNLVLLRKEVEMHPDCAYLKYQLGVEFELRKMYEQAVSYYQIARELGETSAPWRMSLILRLLFCLKKLKQFDKVFRLAAEEENSYSKVCPDFNFLMGDIYLDAALSNPADANKFINKIEQSWLNCLSIGETPQVSGTIIGRGSYLAAYNLAVFYASLKQQQSADKFFTLASSLKQHTEKKS